MIRRSASALVATLTPALAAVGLALLSAPVTRAAEPRRAPPPASIDLQPAEQSNLDTVELEIADARQTRPQRRDITDLLVVLLPNRTPLDRALGPAGGHGTAAERRLFLARLSVVSGGRLIRGPSAWCGGFEGGLSVCEVDCDGGRFSIRLNTTGDARFALIVGPGTSSDDDSGGGTGARTNGGVSLSACSLDGAGDTRLVARRGAVADIALNDE